MWRTNTLEKPSCWERLRKVEGEGDNKRWDGWMASLTWWTWVKASFSCWLWTGKPGVLQSKGSQFNSVQFSHSVVSDSLRPHESQHAGPPCPSPTPGVHSCPLSQWRHPAISSFVIPFSSCPQSLPASESFPVSQLFAWGGQSTGVSVSQIELSDWTELNMDTRGCSRTIISPTSEAAIVSDTH